MLTADGISFEYGNKGAPLLSLCDVTMYVEAGEIVGLVGRSGTGKSTLARILSGLLRPHVGQVCYNGLMVIQPEAQVAYVAQDYQRAVLPWLTVKRNIELGRYMTKYPRHSLSSVDEVAEELGIQELLGVHPPGLSGGQIQRVQIGRALYAGVQYLILDEPTTSLDLEFRHLFQEILGRITQQRQIGVLLVTHEIDDAVLLSKRLYVMTKDGNGRASLREEQGYGVVGESRDKALDSSRFREAYRCVYKKMFEL